MTTTINSSKEVSRLITQLFKDTTSINYIQTEIIVQEMLKRNHVAVFDYIAFHMLHHKAVGELSKTDLNIIKETLETTLEIVNEKLEG